MKVKRIGTMFAETVLLFAALFFTLPAIPSNEVARLPLFPAAAFAAVLFGISRFLRWRGSYAIVAAETAAFALFVWGSNAIANHLYAH